MNLSTLRKSLLPAFLLLFLFISASCGFLQPPAPQPQLSATDIPPQATALSALPPTWTPEPTPTPVPPSPTPQPTQDPENYRIDLALTPIAEPFLAESMNRVGWKEMAGNTAAIEIPPEYEILDFAGTFMELMTGLVEAFTAGFADLALNLGEELGAAPDTALPTPDLGEFPEIDFLIALEEKTASAILLVSVESTPATTTEDLINQSLSGQENSFNPVSWTTYTDAPFPIDRVIIDLDDPEQGPGKQVIYVILGDDRGWNLIFTSPEELFGQKLPQYENIVQTFSITE